MRVESVGQGKFEGKGILAAGLSEKKDDVLVNEAAQGSEAAFEVLFQRYQQKMFHIANRIVRNREDAEDAVQQAFKHAFVHLRAFQGDARFSTWLTRISINEALQLLRKRRPGHTSLENHTAQDGSVAPLEIQDEGATPEENYEQQEMRGILNEAIGELRPILRKVVDLYEIGELHSGEAAQVLGLSNGTVKARAFRARRLLRQKLEVRMRVKNHTGKTFLFAPTRNVRSYVRHEKVIATAA